MFAGRRRDCKPSESIRSDAEQRRSAGAGASGRGGEPLSPAGVGGMEPAMPDAATFMAFLAAVLAMQAVPGPDTMLVVSRGVGQGRVVAVATALGAVAAGLVQLPLLAAGVRFARALVAARLRPFALRRRGFPRLARAQAAAAAPARGACRGAAHDRTRGFRRGHGVEPDEPERPRLHARLPAAVRRSGEGIGDGSDAALRRRAEADRPRRPRRHGLRGGLRRRSHRPAARARRLAGAVRRRRDAGARLAPRRRGDARGKA